MLCYALSLCKIHSCKCNILALGLEYRKYTLSISVYLFVCIPHLFFRKIFAVCKYVYRLEIKYVSRAAVALYVKWRAHRKKDPNMERKKKKL